MQARVAGSTKNMQQGICLHTTIVLPAVASDLRFFFGPA